jgi:hypothetical protein
MTLSPALDFTASKGQQNPVSFQGGPKDVLEASFDHGAHEPVGLQMTSAQSDNEAVEVNSVL